MTALLNVLKFAEVTQDVQIAKAEPRYLQQLKTPIKSGYISTPRSIKSQKTPSSFSFGPKIPNIRLDLEDPEKNTVILDKLAHVLRARKQKSDMSRREFDHKVQHFRKRLTDLNQENILSKSEIRNLKAMLKKDKLLIQNLHVKINDLETISHDCLTKNDDQEQLIQNLQFTIDEKNLKLNQNCLEQEKNKQKLVLQAEKLNQQFDDKLRRQKQELEIEKQARDLKLKKVRELIDSDMNVELTPTRPEIALPLSEREFKENTPLYTCESINERNIVCNRITRRAGEVWLEHNSIKPIPLHTVLQPSMKRRKSVDKLKKATDITNPKQNKYCLIAQESDGIGDVETKLYKGDIVPTCGGGAQVIFNGVECLREESPTKMPLSPNNK